MGKRGIGGLGPLHISTQCKTLVAVEKGFVKSPLCGLPFVQFHDGESVRHKAKIGGIVKSLSSNVVGFMHLINHSRVLQ